MGETTEALNDPVLLAVQALNAGWKNTEYSKRRPQPIGKGSMYTVVYKGQDDIWREDYVFEIGETRRAYHEVSTLVLDPLNNVIARQYSTDFIKLIVVSLLTLMFATSVIYLAISAPENKSLQVLTGLLGLTIGYFVGKVDPPAP